MARSTAPAPDLTSGHGNWRSKGFGAARRFIFGTLTAGAFVFLAASFFVPEAKADFTDAMSAKDPRRQHMLLRRAAWAENDPLAQAELCRRYSAGGPGLADPVEAFVWCSLASYNMDLEGVSVRSIRRQYEDVFGTGYAKRAQMYRRLRTTQRTEGYERITYILACQGASGLLKLGELYHPYRGVDGELTAQTGSGEDYREDLNLKRIWLQDTGIQYFNDYFSVYFQNNSDGAYDSGRSSSSASSAFGRGPRNGFRSPIPPPGSSGGDYDGGEDDQDQNGDDGAGLSFQPGDVSGSFHDGSDLPRNAIEALTFYILAHRAGHPYAGDLRDKLERELAATLRNPGDARVIREEAEAAADIWIPPFEIYADAAEGREGRYSDACPVTGQWEAALHRMRELDVRDDQFALKWLQYHKDNIDNQTGPATRGAVRDFQVANNWFGTGRLTDYQRSTLIRLAAVAGDTHSQETLGFMYACGIGVAPDEVRASHWYRQAYDQGSALAAYNLGLLYQGEDATALCRKGAETGTVRKVKPDEAAAERYIRRAYVWGFRTIDPAFRRRFDLPQLRFGGYASDDNDETYDSDR